MYEILLQRRKIMAETKKTTKTTTKKPATKTTAKKSATKTTTTTNSSASKTQSTQKSSRRSGGIRTWGLNKISFWCIGAMAILYLIASILALCGVNLQVVTALQGVATALAICIVAFLAWKYVRPKQAVWKVLYFVLLLVVLLGIILPLVV